MISRKVLDRLHKLRALEGSSFEHEAAAARLAAQKIMEAHGLSREDVDRAINDALPREVVLEGSAWQSSWKLVVVTAAAAHCGVRAYSTSRGGRREIRVEGEDRSVGRSLDLVEGMLSVVAELRERAAADVESDAELADALGVFGRSSSVSYSMGAAYALGKLFEEVRRGVARAAPEEGKLVRAGEVGVFDDVERREEERGQRRRGGRRSSAEIFRGIDPAWARYGYEMVCRLVEVSTGGDIIVRDVPANVRAREVEIST